MNRIIIAATAALLSVATVNAQTDTTAAALSPAADTLSGVTADTVSITTVGTDSIAVSVMAMDSITGPEKFEITVDTGNEIAAIQPNMYGIFFEDINFGADGGLYAEMIKNRSFDFEHPMTGWTPFGKVSVAKLTPSFKRMPNYVVLEAGKNLTGTGLDNEGFLRGMGIEEGREYRLTFYSASPSPSKLRFELITSGHDNPYGIDVVIDDRKWTKHTVILRPEFTDKHARLRVRLTGNADVLLDHISLMPMDTWKRRENGMRRDLVEALDGLNPGVFRFPGGCIVEGTDLATRYQWKNTIGPVENRPLNINRWNYTFKHKFFPDYYQSYGLGFYEYFLLCEDLGADALPVLSCGLACQFENDECVPLDDLQPYIDDALDLIEFANGDAGSQWGKVRAEMGHPEPFNLKMIGIGNEQWGEAYPQRLEMFVKAIREKYPQMLIVGSSGPNAEGDKFEYLWPEMKRIGVDLVDEHYYKPPEWFFENAGRYDDYDRSGPKVFAGEYAAHHHPSGKANNFLSALSEAAFMTGLERNADVVQLATYAPLFAHVDGWQWNPDLIWFDNLDIMLTPNYYVQQLYAAYKGTNALSTASAQSDLKGGKMLYATSAVDKDNSRIIVKVVNAGDTARIISLDIAGEYGLSDSATITVLQSDDPLSVNTFDEPYTIIPQTRIVEVKDGKVDFAAEKYSFSVVVIEID